LIKKFGIPLLKIIISLGLIFYISNKLGLRKIAFEISSIKFSWFLLAIIVFSISNILGSIQWHWLLRIKNAKVKLIRIISSYHVGLFFNNFLVGYIGGDPIRIYDVSRLIGNNSLAFSSVFMDRLIGFAVLTTLALGAALYWINLFNSNNILFIIIAIFIAWILLFVFFFNEKFIKKFNWIFKLILPVNIGNKLKEIYRDINTYKHHKKDIMNIIGLSVVIQALRIIVHYVIALSLNVHISVVYFFIFIPIIALLSSLPISIGGIGVRETSGVALFAQIWSNHQDIVAFEFLSFVIGILCTLPGGIIFMLRKEIVPHNSTEELIN
jgi:glycosyltransferase 2 family protein